jgi:hypothetical protein
MCSNPICFDTDCQVIYGYCHCGCGELTQIAKYSKKQSGWIKGIHRKYVRGHGTRIDTSKAYIVDEATGCWIWIRGKNKDGYGQITVNGKSMDAHKYFYVKKYGPVPKGKELDHFVCQNRACCNPDHVEPVTDAENVQRGKSAKVTKQRVICIRVLYATKKFRQSDLSELFGVCQVQIGRIVNKESWK